ncbi:phage tail tube protein [Neobacillus sp. NPDC058068]|uniref:phage tail tube protein n=1 Tax=Neobacillus sp. NPDC058068 TaxID=3346325 RepID=UPI0036DF9802
MAGVLTKETKLSYKKSSTFEEIDLLMEVPDLGGEPEKVEVTTLKDSVKKYIPGVRDLGDLVFKFLYDNSSTTSNYRVLRGLQDAGKPVDFKVTYPDKTEHAFTAYVNVKMDSGAPNAALTFSAGMSLQSDIVVTNPTP